MEVYDFSVSGMPLAQLRLALIVYT